MSVPKKGRDVDAVCDDVKKYCFVIPNSLAYVKFSYIRVKRTPTNIIK